MNQQLQDFARQTLKDGLVKLPEKWQTMFKLMYARDGGRRSMEDAILMDINQVVDQMPPESLNWALSQVDNSLKKLKSPS